MITYLTRVLDQLTLVRLYKSLPLRQEFLDTFSVANMHADNAELKKKKKKYVTVFTKSYDGKKWSTGIAFRFFSVQTHPAIAIEVTPTKLSDDDWADFLGFLVTMFPYGGKTIYSTFRISKLEVALDVKVPYGELICFSPGIKSIDQKYLAHGTLYLGHRYGNRSFSIYDKRKQLAEKKKPQQLGYDQTRIEARHRHLGQTLETLSTLPDPFGRLIAIRKSKLQSLIAKHPTNSELKQFGKTALSGSKLITAQHGYVELDSDARKRIVKLLRPHALNLNGDADRWDAWIAGQQAAIGSNLLMPG